MAKTTASRNLISTESIIAALQNNNGNRAAAARELKCTSRTIERRVLTDGIKDFATKMASKYTIKQLKEALTRSNGIVSTAAKELNIHRASIQRRMNISKTLRNHCIRCRQQGNAIKHDNSHERVNVPRTWDVNTVEHSFSKLGELYETYFKVKCMEHGLHPHNAPGDYLAHDTIVLNNNGKMFRVQIKGTNTTRTMRSFRIRAAFAGTFLEGQGVRSKGDPTKLSQVDVFAAYFEQANVWYIVPIKAITCKTLCVFPLHENSAGKYEQYKDNWDIFQ